MPTGNGVANDEQVNPHRAMQRFFQPVYSPMDCELVGRAHKDEIDEHFAALYFSLDRSHDRTISRGEFFAQQSNATDGEKAYLYEQMDADGDGSVSPDEYRLFAYRAFDLLDLDQDGDLTESEVDMAAFRKEPHP